jgi:hypothetical protein
LRPELRRSRVIARLKERDWRRVSTTLGGEERRAGADRRREEDRQFSAGPLSAPKHEEYQQLSLDNFTF